MKKVYQFLLCALFAVLSFNAYAADPPATSIQITVKADPEVTKEIWVGPNSAIIDSESWTKMSFSKEGVVNTAYYTGTFAYVKVVPKENGKKYNVVAYKADNSRTAIVSNKQVASNSAWNFINNFDGGVLEVEDLSSVKEYIYVTIEGDPSEVYMDVQGKQVTGLTVGENKLEYTNRYINFKATNGKAFYEFLYNGAVKNGSYDAAEGAAGVYNYVFTSAKANDRFYINTVWPDVKYNISIDAGEYQDFVTSVTLDGEPVSDWASFQCDPNASLLVNTDLNNYIVRSVTINGVEPDGFTGKIGRDVAEDLEIVFDVVPLVRDKSITVKLPSGFKLEVYNNANAKIYEGDGGTDTHTVDYCQDELPLVIFSDSTGSSEITDSRMIYRNGGLVAHDVYSYRLTEDNFQNGDAFEITFEKPYFVVNCETPAGVVMTLYGTETEFTSGTHINVKSSPDTNTVTFAAAEGYKILSVVKNGAEVEGTDGVYDCGAPFNLDQITVTVEKIPCIYVTVTDPSVFAYGGVILGDELVELEEGQNWIDITELDEDAELVVALTPGAPYYFESVIYNNEDVTGDENYFVEGYYTFPIAAEDQFTFNVEEVVRDQKALVYISGLSNLNNPYVAEATGNVALVNEFSDNAYHEVYFHHTDNPVFFQADQVNSNMYVYINDELMDHSGNHFQWEAAHNDVVKIYVQDEEPEPVMLVFSTDGAKPAVTVDHVKDINWFDVSMMDEEEEEEPIVLNYFNSGVLPGTHVSLEAPAGESYTYIEVNGQKLNPVDGKYEFVPEADEATGFCSIDVYSDTMTGIAAIEAAAGEMKVYNLQGIAVKSDKLARGLYIIDGKKVVVK